MGVQVQHLVRTVHFAHIAAQVCSRYILKGFIGLYNRRLSDHTFSFHFSQAQCAVYNIPAAAEQLHRHFGIIIDGDAIGKHIFPIYRTALRILIKCFYRNTNPFCNFLYHIALLLQI
ncbi:hypothetical protein D9M69_658140 [compost metagenome]